MPVFDNGQKITSTEWNRLIESVPASYVVWKDGSTYRAECLLKGGEDYSDPDAATVIQSAHDALTDGGLIFLKGEFQLTTYLNVTNKVSFYGDSPSNTVLRLSGTATYIAVCSDSYIRFHNLAFNGNSKQGNGLKFTGGAHYAKVDYCDFYNFVTAIDVNVDSGTSALLGIIEHNAFGSCTTDISLTASAGKWANDWRIIRNRIKGTTGIKLGFGDGNNSGTNIIGNSIEGCTTGISMDSKAYYAVIRDNRFESITTGISQDDAVQNVHVLDNTFVSVGTPISGSPHSSWVIKQNTGFVTENGGTATISNGSTSIVVSHGCDYTPSAEDIDVHPIESLGSANFWWVDTITSTQFTIHVNADPGQDVDFKWSVRRI